MSFNIYTDIEEQFLYIEKNGNWYMTLYDIPEVGEIHIIPVPEIKDASELIKEDVNEYDCFEDHEITRCSDCENKGYFFDNWSLEYEVCPCYHGQRIGYEKLETFLNDKEEEFYSHDEYLAWKWS